MDMEKLTELKRRVDAATRPDRELDALLWAMADKRDVEIVSNALYAKHREPPHDVCVLGWIDPGKHRRNFSMAAFSPPIPSYTASIDAALELVGRVLPGKRRVILYTNPAHAEICKIGDWEGEQSADKDFTPPLAILSALLAALIAEGE